MGQNLTAQAYELAWEG